MKHFFLLFLCFTTLLVKSQLLTLGYKDLKVNNIAHSVNSAINLGEAYSVNVKFNVDMTVSSSFQVGYCNLFVRVHQPNGLYSDIVDSKKVYVSGSGSGIEINGDILRDYISYENGNYLTIELVHLDTGTVWYSPKITVVKTPSFTLSPGSVTIPCGSTSPITFTCNSNTGIGSFVYKWNVGNGWTKDGVPVSGIITTSSNSITLAPADVTILPSNLSLEIIWNSNYSFGKGSNVQRQSFDSANTLQISGNTATVCTFPTTVSYSINAEAGNSVSWISSDSSVGELVNSNGPTTDVILKRQGEITLTATVVNQCGQTKTVTKKFWAGTPLVYMPNAACGNPYDSVCFNSNYNVQTGQYSNVVVDALGQDGTQNPNTDFEWEKVNGPFIFVSYGNGNNSTVSNNGTKVTGRMAILYITSGYNYMQVRARAKNVCGWGPWKAILFQSGGSKMGISAKEYQVSPNPASDFINISLFDETNNMISKNSSKVYAELYNVAGTKVGKTNMQNNKGRISVVGLHKGIYTLKIYSDKWQEDHQVIVK